MTKPIVRWQYEQLEGTLGLLEEHLTNPECPCKTEGEACPRKHLKRAEDYARETITILSRDGKNQAEIDKLYELAKQAREYRQAEERLLCGKKAKEGELVEPGWASKWRKYFEGLVIGSCDTAKVKEPITVADIASMSGTVYQDIIIKSLDRSKQITLQAKVDTGATFAYVPRKIIQDLGLPYANQDVPHELFNGSKVMVPFYHCIVEVNGQERATSVGVGKPTIGHILLEIYKLKPNPTTGKLEPATDLELWEMRQKDLAKVADIAQLSANPVALVLWSRSYR